MNVTLVGQTGVMLFDSNTLEVELILCCQSTCESFSCLPSQGHKEVLD